jgi:hypothetical protein
MSVLWVWLGSIIVGPGVFVLGVWRLYAEFQRRRWQRVTGRVVRSWVRKGYVGRGGYESVPNLEVEFVHAGVVTRSCVELDCTGTRESAAVLVSKHPSGVNVVVFVNPNKPSQIVLNPAIRVVSWLLVLAGGLLSLIEMALLLGA